MALSYTPKHMARKENKPMRKAIKFTLQLLTFVALTYATFWISFQFVVLVNHITTHAFE